MRKKATVWLLYDRGKHSYETTGNSLFEIAARALAHFVQNGYVPPTRLAQAEMQVQFQTVHRVKAERVYRWLGEGVGNDFRLQLVKQQIWEYMKSRD